MALLRWDYSLRRLVRGKGYFTSAVHGRDLARQLVVLRNRLASGLPEPHALPLLVSELCGLVGMVDHVGAQRLVDMTLSDLRTRGEVAATEGVIVLQQPPAKLSSQTV